MRRRPFSQNATFSSFLPSSNLIVAVISGVSRPVAAILLSKPVARVLVRAVSSASTLAASAAFAAGVTCFHASLSFSNARVWPCRTTSMRVVLKARESKRSLMRKSSAGFFSSSARAALDGEHHRPRQVLGVDRALGRALSDREPGLRAARDHPHRGGRLVEAVFGELLRVLHLGRLDRFHRRRVQPADDALDRAEVGAGLDRRGDAPVRSLFRELRGAVASLDVNPIHLLAIDLQDGLVPQIERRLVEGGFQEGRDEKDARRAGQPRVHVAPGRRLVAQQERLLLAA